MAADGQTILFPDQWDTNGDVFLAENSSEDHYLVRRYQSEFYAHDENGWLPVRKEDWQTRMHRWLRAAKYASTNAQGLMMLRGVHPESLEVEKLSFQIQCETLIDSTEEIPVWTEGAMPERWDNQKEHIVLLNDCALNLLTGDTVPRNPGLFSPFQLDAVWVPNAPEPTQFLAALRQVFTEETDGQIKLLQEIMGYALSTSTKHQKGAYIRGPARSFKGTLARILGRFHKGRTTTTTPRKLGRGFGDQNTLDKRLMVFSDLRVDSNSAADIIDFVLAVIGNDHQSVPRKFKENWEGALKLFVLVLSNLPLSLRDSSGVLATRFLYLVTDKSFLGSEDLELEDRLWDQERDAILRWCVRGYQRLTEQGHFSETDVHRRELGKTQVRMQNVTKFVEDCCVVEAKHRQDGSVLYQAYEYWCENNGSYMLDRTRFGQVLSQEFPNTSSRPTRKDGHQIRMRYGMALEKGWSHAAIGTQDDALEKETGEAVAVAGQTHHPDKLPF